MSADIQRPTTPDGTTAPTRSRSLPVTRVIVASLVAGVLATLVLTLVVFPGATESVITGSTLLGFGLGWAMMAARSARRTSRPQRWATVPAVAMSATGTGLLLLTPQDAALTMLNWVWPPVMLALAVWMFVQTRRTLSGRGRWLLTPVLVVLAVASIGATVQNVAATRLEEDFPAPGKRYSVGDHRLHLDCRGQGGPTVVLLNGLGEISASWARITDDLRGTARVCAYDRAGQGWSDDVSTPQDGVAAAEDLQILLTRAGEEGPYVLVGHSTGGPYALTYADRFPEQVAGVVLLDSSSPEQFTRMPAYPAQYAVMRRGYALLPPLRRVGLGQLLPPASHLPGADADRVTALTSSPQAARNQRDELSVIPDLFEQAQALTTLGDLPLAVLTASANVETAGWVGAQEQLAVLSTNHVHRTVDSSHAGLLEDAGPAAETVRAVTEVISSVRTDTTLGAP